MSISYGTVPYNFVDSQFGTASSGHPKTNVPVIYDRMYHRQTQTKVLFKKHGLIGDDGFNEGDTEQTAVGFPVIRKTNFSVNKGDTIIMHLEKNINAGVNSGIVGQNQLVDNEVGWNTDNLKVKIEQYRNGLLTYAGMNEQRNPYSESLIQLQMDKLSTWSAQTIDTGILYALHYGSAPHLYRQYGTTNVTCTANANTLFGNDLTMDTTRTIANLQADGSDNISPRTFEIGYAYAQKRFFDFINVDGRNYLGCLISVEAFLALYQNEDFRKAMYFARDRGVDNPLFKYGDAVVYGNCIIWTYEKMGSILAAKNPAGLSISNAGAYNSSITEADYTGIGGGLTTSQLTQVLFLGANAVCLAEGQMAMRERYENDYSILLGRAADNIWGAKRTDWLSETGSADLNQSSLNMVVTRKF